VCALTFRKKKSIATTKRGRGLQRGPGYHGPTRVHHEPLGVTPFPQMLTQGLYLIPLGPLDEGCKTSKYDSKPVPTNRTCVAEFQFGHDLKAVEH
jgi:hypothetical protein